MSLILDALNRSRQESDPVPGLATHHPMEQRSAGKRQLLPWAALVVALVLIAWLLLEPGDDQSPASSAGSITAPVAELSKNIGSAASAVKTQLKSRVETERNEKARAQAVSPPADTPEALTVPAVTEQARGAAIAPALVATTRPATTQTEASPAPRSAAPAAKNTASDAVAKLYQQQETAVPLSGSVPAPAATPSGPAARPAADTPPPAPVVTQEQAQTPANSAPAAQRDEQQVDIEELLVRARDEMENTALLEHPAPFVSSLSQNTKDSIPTVLYQRHDYSNKTGRSSVVLNGKSLRAGGSPAAGVKVDEILQDSVVLSYRGTQFRLRALNSWVNL